ncbi:uncharacterized protein LOC125946884 [Dermacentor silvarum]|uniref:uncharacterized protein LOC125946884 n=1 Tax=Dermacentor silvarum TaxID=543639 RepID=UPI002100CD1D|nr:uncharacterized protein LOC125946884 [Dermacentor silvarum]
METLRTLFLTLHVYGNLVRGDSELTDDIVSTSVDDALLLLNKTIDDEIPPGQPHVLDELDLHLSSAEIPLKHMNFKLGSVRGLGSLRRTTLCTLSPRTGHTKVSCSVEFAALQIRYSGDEGKDNYLLGATADGTLHFRIPNGLGTSSDEAEVSRVLLVISQVSYTIREAVLSSDGNGTESSLSAISCFTPCDARFRTFYTKALTVFLTGDPYFTKLETAIKKVFYVAMN